MFLLRVGLYDYQGLRACTLIISELLSRMIRVMEYKFPQKFMNITLNDYNANCYELCKLFMSITLPYPVNT